MMEYSDKIQKAIRFAIKTHEIYQQQKRKGSDVSYITHPLVVGIILAKVTAKEDIICAGILHDTVEDSVPDKKVSREMIEERFGTSVADVVASVTEKDKTLPWVERKGLALQKIPQMSKESLLVKSADVIANGRDVILDYSKNKDTVFENFNAPEPKKDNIVHGQIRLISAITESWSDNPLIQDLNQLSSEFGKIVAA